MTTLNTVPLAIGLDSDINRRRMRMVCLIPDRKYPTVWDHRCFRNLRQFENYWRRHIEPREEHGLSYRVVASGHRDPLGIVEWLRSQGVPVEDLENEFLQRELPQTYHQAFALAFREAQRIEEPAALQDLWYRLLVVRDELRTISINLGAVAHAPAGLDHEDIDVPF